MISPSYWFSLLSLKKLKSQEVFGYLETTKNTSNITEMTSEKVYFANKQVDTAPSPDKGHLKFGPKLIKNIF